LNKKKTNENFFLFKNKQKLSSGKSGKRRKAPHANKTEFSSFVSAWISNQRKRKDEIR